MDASPRDVSTLPATGIRYSVCSLITRRDDYEAMVASFVTGGFTFTDCEYLYADNSERNQVDAYAAYNTFLTRARGAYVILCHQDVVLLRDGRARLDWLLAQLDCLDATWGLCGNAGKTESGTGAIRITDPHGSDTALGGPFPVRVMSLDENFIVVRRDANLALSRDMAGFHWYGADLCIIADILGHRAYVIDFHLMHRSGGRITAEFHDTQRALCLKYRRAFRARRYFAPTGYSFLIAPSWFQRAAGVAGTLFARLRRAIRIR